MSIVTGFLLTTATSGFAAISYAYDELGRLVAVTDPAAGSAQYAYDAVGNTTSIVRLASTAVKIFEFAPNSGDVGQAITISGTGFSATPAQNTVKFNGTTATVVSATTTQIVATVPVGATNGPISVTAPGGTHTSAASFTVGAPNSPTISNVAPLIVAASTQAAPSTVTVTGTRFESTPSNNNALINGIRARVTSSVATSLAFELPVGAGSGKVTVQTPFGKAVSSQDVYVAPPGYAPADVAFTDRTSLDSPKVVTVGTAGKVGLLLFDATAGQRAYISISGSGIGSWDDFAVYRPDGTRLGSGLSFDAQELNQTGTYAILLDPAGSETGSLTVNVASVPSDVVASISADGTPTSISTAIPGQNAHLYFDGTQNQRVFVKITGSTYPSALIQIRKPDFTVLKSLALPSGGDFIDTSTLPASDRYEIFVDPSQGATGGATITLYDVPTDDTTAIATDGTLLSRTLAVGQNGVYTFTASPGDRFYLNVPNPQLNFNAITIKGPDGSVLGQRTFPAGGGIGWDVETTAATQAGTHTVTVDPFGYSAGPVQLKLYSVPADVTGTITVDGPSVHVDLPSPGQNAFLTFSGNVNARFRFTFANVGPPGGSDCCIGVAQVFSPTGQLEGASDFGTLGSTLTFDLTGTGTHTLVLNPTGPATTSLDVSLITILSGNSLAGGEGGEAALGTPTAAPEVTSPSAPTGAVATATATGDASELAPDAAPEGVTGLTGVVRRLDGRPLAGVTLEVGSVEARTDREGRFLLAGLEPGPQLLEIDGTTANTASATFGFFETSVDLEPNMTTKLDYTIWMPKLDRRHVTAIPKVITKEIVVKTPRIPGLELRIPAGATVTDEDGEPVRELSITPIPVAKPPFPLPRGVNVPIYFTIQPGGAYISPGARLIYPNYTHLAAGTRVNFWRNDPEAGGWSIYGKGTVTLDGRQVVPDLGVEVYELTGAMIAPIDDIAWALGAIFGGVGGGDPVDLATGLFEYRKTDLALPDVLPINLDRVYSPADGNVREFGIGSSHSYELTLWPTANNYQGLALVLPGGSRVNYVRTSPGTGFGDAVFEAQSTPTDFYKSTVAWVPGSREWHLKKRDGTVYVFGEEAPLKEIRDRFGNRITLTRQNVNVYGQPIGNVTRIRSSNGRWVEFSFDGLNRITQAKDNLGRTVGYQYDASGRLWKVTDPAGGVTEYGYDAQNRMTTVKDPRSITYLTNQYDANGRIQLQTLGDGKTYQFAYTLDANGKVTQTDVTDQRGNVTRYQFNASGYATSVVRGLGTAVQQTSTIARQAGSNLISSITDQLGRVTAYTYDARGNVATVTRLSGTPNAVTTTYAWDPSHGQLTSVTDPLNHSTSIGYTPTGALQSITDARNKTWTFATNPAGQVTGVTDPLNHTTTYTYELGDLTSTTDAVGRVWTRLSDGGGRVIAARDPLGVLTRVSYNALNLPASTTDGLGGVTQFGYDGNGNLTSLTDARNKVWQFTWDTMDRMLTRKDPLLATETYTYDNAGNLATVTTRKNERKEFQYDALNRVTFAGFKTTPGAGTYESTITYTWDGGNRLTQLVDSVAGTVTRTPDLLDRITQEQTPNGTLTYTYDNADRQTGLTVTGQPQVVYGYDNADNPTTVTQGATSVTIGYDDAGRRATLTLPNGIVANYGYTNADDLSSISYLSGATTIANLTYGLDAAGQPVSIGGSLARTSLPAAVASAVYDNANRLTNWGATALTYDANGQLSNDGTLTYTWNVRGQLTQVKQGATTKGTFVYDPLGRRQQKTLSGTVTKLVYDGLNPVQEKNNAGTPVANLLTGLGLDELYQRTDSAGARSLLTDHLGGVVELTDPARALLTHYTYEPFGKPTATGTANANPYQFASRDFDSATGLIYERARYYHPGHQRFITQDPIGFLGGSSNLYSYVSASPTQGIDPLGLSSWDPRSWHPIKALKSAGQALSDVMNSRGMFVISSIATGACFFTAGVGCTVAGVIQFFEGVALLRDCGFRGGWSLFGQELALALLPGQIGQWLNKVTRNLLEENGSGQRVMDAISSQLLAAVEGTDVAVMYGRKNPC